MGRFMLALGFAVTLLLAMQAVSRSETTIACPKTKGFIGGPFVPTEDMAREIFKVMVGRFASFNVEQYPVIVVEDGGDHWWATQRDVEPIAGRYGGGQLYMNIDKCTGAISRAAYNR